MKARWNWRLATVVSAVLLPLRAHAAGYGIYEQGAAALGMAGAVTASVRDASALFFNPAAMTHLDGLHVYVGGNILSPGTSFAGVSPYPGYGVTEEMNPQHFFTPTIYVTHRYEGPWAVGVGLNTPFGLGVDWKDPDRFTGRYIVTQGRLRTSNLNLSAAYQVSDMWSVAAGGSAMWAKVELQNRLLVPVPGGGGAQVDVAESRLESDWKPGYGWNAAVSFVPAVRWKLGAYYRSKVVVDAQGNADFSQILTGSPALDTQVAQSLPPDQGGGSTLRFPAIWSGGVAYLPTEGWTVEATINYTEWSLFEDLPLRFELTPAADQTIVEDYENSLQVRLGAEHRLPAFTYRFGYYFDQAAAPTKSVSPLLPDADRHGVSLGLGLGFGQDKRWTLDAYDLGLFFNRRSTDGVNRDGFNGEYSTFVNLAGVSLDYRW